MAHTINPQLLTTADDILKIDYLPGFQRAFNQETVLLYRLRRKTAEVYGTKYVWPVHARRNFGTGPRAETGGISDVPYLPIPGRQAFDQAYLQRAHYYGRFKITGAAMSAAKGRGGMIDLLGTEMRGLKDDLARHVNRDLFQEGTGYWATVTADSGGSTTVTVDSTRLLEAKMRITIANTSNGVILTSGDVMIESITSSTAFVIDASLSTTTSHSIYPGTYYNDGSNDIASAYDNAATGLALAVDSGDVSATYTYADINRNTAGNDFWKSTELDGSAGLTIDLMFQAQIEMRKKASGKNTLIVTSPSQFRQYGNLFKANREWVGNLKKLDGGWDSLEFNGVPIVYDFDCQDDVMYFLDESTLAILEEEPINFIDQDGAVLVRVGSGASAEDAFEASLVWRMNLACYNPAKNAKITGLPTTVNP